MFFYSAPGPTHCARASHLRHWQVNTEPTLSRDWRRAAAALGPSSSLNAAVEAPRPCGIKSVLMGLSTTAPRGASRSKLMPPRGMRACVCVCFSVHSDSPKAPKFPAYIVILRCIYVRVGGIRR